MINLIPPKTKKRLQAEYWVRVVSVWLVLWSIGLLIGASVLLPVYVLIGSQVDTYEASANEASQKVADYERAAQLMQRSNEEAKMIDDSFRVPRISTYIDRFNALRESGIQITEVLVGQKEGELTPAIIQGVADDRVSLASFRDRLLEEDAVASVDLPINNLARDKDIVFSLTVNFNNKTDL